MIISAQLQQIMPTAKRSAVDLFYPHLVTTMVKFHINTPLRMAAFIAQIAHESGNFRYTKELWGNTTQQQKYEPPSKLSVDLGNTSVGDGFRYRGRGLIQITGRANYTKVAADLGIDCVNSPEILETPQYACLTAGLFWDWKKLNAYADSKDLIGMTKRINGGLNGIHERTNYYLKALEIIK